MRGLVSSYSKQPLEAFPKIFAARCLERPLQALTGAGGCPGEHGVKRLSSAGPILDRSPFPSKEFLLVWVEGKSKVRMKTGPVGHSSARLSRHRMSKGDSICCLCLVTQGEAQPSPGLSSVQQSVVFSALGRQQALGDQAKAPHTSLVMASTQVSSTAQTCGRERNKARHQ